MIRKITVSRKEKIYEETAQRRNVKEITEGGKGKRKKITRRKRGMHKRGIKENQCTKKRRKKVTERKRGKLC